MTGSLGLMITVTERLLKMRAVFVFVSTGFYATEANHADHKIVVVDGKPHRSPQYSML